MYQEKHLSLSKLLFTVSCIYMYFTTRLLTPYLIVLCIFFHVFLFYIYDTYFQKLNHQFEKEREYILKESIHTRIYDREEDLYCDICYDTVSKGESYAELVCNCREKYYHHSCIETWFMRKNVCPFCRKEFNFL